MSDTQLIFGIMQNDNHSWRYSGGVTVSREGALFSYLVQIGKLTACNFIRKRKNLTSEVEL